MDANSDFETVVVEAVAFFCEKGKGGEQIKNSTPPKSVSLIQCYLRGRIHKNNPSWTLKRAPSRLKPSNRHTAPRVTPQARKEVSSKAKQ